MSNKKNPCMKGKEIAKAGKSGMIYLLIALAFIVGFGTQVEGVEGATVTTNLSLTGNTRILDSYVDTDFPSTNYGADVTLQIEEKSGTITSKRSYVIINLSDIASSIEDITSAIFELEYDSVSIGIGTQNVSLFEIFRPHIGWKETVITENNEPCGGSEGSPTFNSSCNSTYIASNIYDRTTGQRKNYTITRLANLSLANTTNNLGIFSFVLTYITSPDDITYLYDSSETINANDQPQLYITYITNSPTIILSEPKNITYNLSMITLNYTANDPNGINQCIRSLDNINKTLTNCDGELFDETTLSEGSHNLKIWVNDSGNNIAVQEISFTFTHTPQLTAQMNKTGQIPKYNVSELINMSGTFKWENQTAIVGTGDSLGRFNVSVRWKNTNNDTIRLLNFTTRTGGIFWDNITLNASAEVGLYWVQIIGHAVRNNTNITTAPLNMPFNLTGINYACTSSNFVSSPGNYTMGNKVNLQVMCNISAGSGDMTFAYDKNAFDNNSGQVFQGADYGTLMNNIITQSDITWTSNPSFTSYLVKFNATLLQNITIPVGDCPSGANYFTNYCINDENVSSIETKYEMRFKINVSSDLISNTILILPMPISFFTDWTSGTRSAVIAYLNGSSNDTSFAFNGTHINVTVGTSHTASSLHEGEWIVAVNYTITTSGGGGGGGGGGSGGGGGGGGGSGGGTGGFSVCGNGRCEEAEGFLTCARDCGLFQILTDNESFIVNRPNIFISMRPGESLSALTDNRMVLALTNYADLNLTVSADISEVNGDPSFNWAVLSIDEYNDARSGSSISFGMYPGSAEIPTIKTINMTITIPEGTQLGDYRLDVKFNAGGVEKSAFIKVTVRDIPVPSEFLFAITEVLQGFFAASLYVPYFDVSLPYWFLFVAGILMLILIIIGLSKIFSKV